MIDRYTRDCMRRIWSDENRYATWLAIELYACEALCELGQIPHDALTRIRERARFDVRRILEIEEVTKHDVIAFTTCVAEFIGEDGRYLHWGLTSSDVLDTSFSMLLRQAAEQLLQDIDALLAVIKEKAYQYKDTVMIGRSHGIHAEPITFGLKMAIWYDEMQRQRHRMLQARDTVSVGKLSGAVGTFAYNPPFVEAYVCRKCGLKPAPVSSQIIQRDVYAEFFCTLAQIGCSLEKFAVEIRHLQRTEVSEVSEYFSPGQKGSSAMPHKRKPVLSENISGLARLLRSYALAAMENVALWHERDISHSSVERVIGPDSTIVLDFMLARLTNVIKNLIVYPDAMKANMDKTGGVFYSQRLLLELTQRGISREDGYRMVQRNALAAWDRKENFVDLIAQDPEVTAIISAEEIRRLCTPEFFTKHVDEIFQRVFGT
ncbi:MAG: adenylosuccinate lyase [Desulfobacterota bacterium]|nr:adenylosuccinate lyase [Thermodesulfobacteriota bacterium]